MLPTLTLPILGALVGVGRAIKVADGSECSTSCGNVLDSTSPDDITCGDESYESGSGGVFHTCVTCELESDYFNEEETDQQWMLYNLRFATSYCLFGFPDGQADSNPCITSRACEPLKDAFAFNDLAGNGSAYDYCAVWNTAEVDTCLQCLRAGDRHTVSNFITLLDAGCLQQPVPGQRVSVEGDPFEIEQVNITDPRPALAEEYQNDDSFPLAAKVGIAIGALAIILVIAGCAIVCNGRRRRKAFLKRLEQRHGHNGWPTPRVNTEMQEETPTSQKPLRGWEKSDSPMSAYTDRTLPRYISPYSSQYNSPVSEASSRMPAYQPYAWRTEKMSPQSMHGPMNIPPPPAGPPPGQDRDEAGMQPGDHIGIALGGDESSGHWDPPTPDKGKGREVNEAYEMQDVSGSEDERVGRAYGGLADDQRGRAAASLGPPMLGHAGFGKMSGSPMGRQGHDLTEDDARRGFAL